VRRADAAPIDTASMPSTAVIATTDGSRAAKAPRAPSSPSTAIAAAWHQ
jgi:hypothetical protein